MANICDNTFYAYSEDKSNLNTIIEFVKTLEDTDITYDDESISAYFSSNWCFPEDDMNNLFESIPNKQDIYMRCLSVEYGCLYHALWICDEYGWKEV